MKQEPKVRNTVKPSPKRSQNQLSKESGTSHKSATKGKGTRPKSIKLENNLTTLKEFLARKAKARQDGLQGNSHEPSNTGILSPSDAVANITNFRREDYRGTKSSGASSSTSAGKFKTIP